MMNYFRGHRGTSKPYSGPDLKDLCKFDETNADASHEVRETFYNALIAYWNEDYAESCELFNQVLYYIPNEPNALHNIDIVCSH